MKKLTILIILVILFSVSIICLSAEEAKYDFRKTNWGMSKEQVKATEDKKPQLGDDTVLGYETTLIGKDSVCVYKFVEDKLWSSGYAFIGEHTNKNLFINDYKVLKESLTQKYGEPKTDKVIWKNDLYKSDEQEWGMAISVGHLKYEASWETSTTKINLSLSGDNYKINLLLIYISKELEKWATQILDEKASKDF